jgi:hypothetical protein
LTIADDAIKSEPKRYEKELQLRMKEKHGLIYVSAKNSRMFWDVF